MVKLQSSPDALHDAGVGLSLRVGREALLRGGVEPCRQPDGRLVRVVLLAHPLATVIVMNQFATLVNTNWHRRLQRPLCRDFRRNDKTPNGEGRRLRRLGGAQVGGIRRSAGWRQAPEPGVRGLEPGLDNF